MRINSINNTNFKGVYLVMGLNDHRKAFKKECDKYPKKVAYIPVSSDKLEPIKNRSESLYTLVKEIYINNFRKKPLLLLTGKDFKRYKKGEEGYKNPDELIGKINGLINLPLFEPKKDLKDLVLKHPDKYVKKIHM